MGPLETECCDESAICCRATSELKIENLTETINLDCLHIHNEENEKEKFDKVEQNFWGMTKHQLISKLQTFEVL